MEILFLGTGSAFTLKNYQTNLLVRKNGKNLLIDAGSDIRFSLDKQGLSYKDLDAVYISHLHGDHSHGLEYIGFCTYFDPSCEKIKLFGNGELLRRGWNDTWKGGLESIQNELLNLESFFDVQSIRPNGFFLWQNIEFRLIQSIHIMNGFYIMPTYGLMAQDRDQKSSKKKIYFTTDMQSCPNQVMDFYKEADVIIHDCETALYMSGVHAHYNELRELPDSVKAKMHLVHYQDNVVMDWKNWEMKAKTEGFSGFAKQGSVLKI